MMIKNKKGFIALIALMVVVTAGLTIGLAISLVGIEELQISLAKSEATKARVVANACVEDGLEKLRRNFVAYSDSLSIDGNSCIINVEVSGSNAIITATGTADVYNQKVRVELDNTLSITSWQEE